MELGFRLMPHPGHRLSPSSGHTLRPDPCLGCSPGPNHRLIRSPGSQNELTSDPDWILSPELAPCLSPNINPTES